MPHAVINGRFLSQAVTGVQRFAREATRALDALAAAGHPALAEWTFEVVAPPDAVLDLPLTHVAARRTAGRLRGQLWEQLRLPAHARGRWLVNLAFTAPLSVRQQVVVIHDASIWAIPHTFTPAFRRWYRFLLPRLARRSARVGTVSAFSRAELERYGVATADRVTVTPNGADHMLAVAPDHAGATALDLPAGRFVLAVSSDAPHKQFSLIEAALAHPCCAAVELVIVGGGGGRTLATERPRGATRARRVGRVSDAVLRALYERALCLVFPSTYEGFGLPPVEAMASGCPVIVSRAGALPEVCGDAALYCAPGDAASLAGQIAGLEADAALRESLVARGRARAAAFTWERTALALVSALDAAGRTAGAA